MVGQPANPSQPWRPYGMVGQLRNPCAAFSPDCSRGRRRHLRARNRAPVGLRRARGQRRAASRLREFARRFGVDALKFVNSEPGRELNLRSIYARIVTHGTVRTGDMIHKAAPSAP